MTKQEFYHELEKVIVASQGTIRGDESLKSLDGWDSMAAVEFIAMADEKMGEPVQAAQLATCKTVADLVGLFAGKIS